MRIWTKIRRFTRMPFRVVFSLMLVSWLGIFLLFTYYSQNSVAVDDVVGTALTKNVDPNLYYIRDIRWLSNSRKQSNRTFKVRKKILIVQRHPATDRRFKVAHVLCKLLDGYRLSYELTRVEDKAFLDIKDALRPEITVGKYSLILFVDIKTFLDLKENIKNSLNSYSRKFNTGILFFATNYVGYARDFQFDIRKPEKEKTPLFVKINSSSSILRMTKDGGQAERPRVPKGLGTRWMYLSFDPARVPYETVSYVLPGLPLAKKRRRRRRRTVMAPQFDRVTVLLDPGKRDGVKRIFFAGGFPFFLHTMLFLDSLDFLSQKTLTFSLDRYLQVDMDDVFIGSKGLRLQRDDVMDLLSVQSSLADKIPGFRFNLGYSGKGYKRGLPEEDEGDEAILEYAHRFTWFGHLYDHEQAHRFSLKNLIKSMKRNRKFAEDYGIPLNTSYAVAPHHSGVYPVHEDLYTAWNKVNKITVTSTEEYPHLKPAWLRRGFIYRGIKVLPRQTCGLFTTTNYFKQIKGGRKALDRSIHGGELFETLLRNPIMIIMTHMTNYANERLAQYTISKLVNYVSQWTNVRLRYALPTKLAEIYFGLFPQDKMPIWQSPCDDHRHLVIWKSDKTCSKLPSFLLVGPPHGGLELLQSLLHLNPDIVQMTNANSSKEVQFFSSENYLKGLDWYMDHFVKPSNPNKISYEPSHSYFTSQAAPQRVHSLLKSSKVIFVLEDPVMIAYAHYKHLLARHKLSHSKFTDIVTSQTNPELLRMRTAILRPGHYAEHIGRWMKYFDPTQMLIIDLNELVNQPINVMSHLQEFLAVDHPLQYNKHVRYSKDKSAFCQILPNNATGNCYKYEKTVPDTLDESTIKYLQRYYAIHNKNLMRINQKIQFKLPKWLQDIG